MKLSVAENWVEEPLKQFVDEARVQLAVLLNPSGQGWPHPTTYVIDGTGAVRWKFTEVNYKIRPTNQMVLDALAKLEPLRR